MPHEHRDVDNRIMNFLQITPFIHVENLETALAFFTGILGFQVTFRYGSGYAYVEREGVGIRIMQASPEHPIPPGDRRFSYYIDVRDVDALYAELKPKLDTLPTDYVMGPVNQRYGQRELMIRAPDGNTLAFGQALPSGT